MPQTILTFPIDADVAAAYESAPLETQQTYQRLLNIWLRELTSKPPRTILDFMDELSSNAQARGLTPEELESILNEE